MKNRKIAFLVPLFCLVLSGCAIKFPWQKSESSTPVESEIVEPSDTEPSIPAHEHSFGEWEVTTQPTCTEAGVETRVCSCGESETRAIEALGHSMVHVDGVEATYTSEGVIEHEHCERCGKDFDADGVELASVVIPELDYAKTVEDVTLDIQTIIGGTGSAFNFSSQAPEGSDLTNTQAEEDLLVVPVSILYSIMPEYLDVFGAHFYTSEEDYWEDESGDTVYQLIMATPRVEVGVEIIGYVYNGALVGQYSVFDGSLLA